MMEKDVHEIMQCGYVGVASAPRSLPSRTVTMNVNGAISMRQALCSAHSVHDCSFLQFQPALMLAPKPELSCHSQFFSTTETMHMVLPLHFAPDVPGP